MKTLYLISVLTSIFTNVYIIWVIIVAVLIAATTGFAIAYWLKPISIVQSKDNASASDTIEKLVQEKEWLVQEIHHRVKNNLQIVMSLLNTQLAYLENEDAQQAIKNSQNRLHAMSLIHHKLYSTNTLSCIDMAWYIAELARHLQDNSGNGHKVHFEIDVATVFVDVSQAVPLGLILNEAIGNALKYAFPGERKGTVSISLHEVSESDYLLRIADDGIGFSPNIAPEMQDTMGIDLMKGLAGQIDGKFYITSLDGVTVTIEFIKKKADI